MLRVLEAESVSAGGLFVGAIPTHIEIGPDCIVEAIWIEAPVLEAGGFGHCEFKAEDKVITVDRAPGYKHFQGLHMRLPAHCTITNGRVNIVYADRMMPK